MLTVTAAALMALPLTAWVMSGISTEPAAPSGYAPRPGRAQGFRKRGFRPAGAKPKSSGSTNNGAADEGVRGAARVGRGQTVELWFCESSFLLPLAHGVLSGEPLDDNNRVLSEGVVREQLGRYPTGYLAGIGLSAVVVCADLQEDGGPIPSLPNVAGTLYLDGEYRPAHLARLIHHEIYHFLDLAQGTFRKDPQWARLSPKPYGKGGREERLPSLGKFTLLEPGFVSGYGKSALAEDKAELFAYWMTEPELVSMLVKVDGVLWAKSRLLFSRIGKPYPIGSPSDAPSASRK